jgi:hypothetical protein
MDQDEYLNNRVDDKIAWYDRKRKRARSNY